MNLADYLNADGDAVVFSYLMGKKQIDQKIKR